MGIGTSPSDQIERAIRQLGDLHMRRAELEQQIAAMERLIFQLRAELQIVERHAPKKDGP